MSLLLAGVNHKTCPVELRERVSALGTQAAHESLFAQGWKEAVILSTCNRFEVYVPTLIGTSLHAALSLESLASWFSDFSGAGVAPFVYREQSQAAIRHLFSVASGLDSLVLGEGEILGQVKQAYESALAAGATGKLTNVLFQRALFVGKSVRTRTTIGMGQVSVASVAVELAKRIFGPLRQSRVLILGAGEMAQKAARHMLSAKAAQLYVANRTLERARQLAQTLSLEAGLSPSKIETVSWESFAELLAHMDVVVASTGATKPVLTRAHVVSALSKRRGRSLFLIDIAMPRAVAEDVADLDGVYLYTMDNLQAIVAENLSRRAGEIEAAREIVRREAAAFGAWLDLEHQGRRASLRHNSSPVAVPYVGAPKAIISSG